MIRRLALASLLFAACGDDPGLRVSPHALHFSPAHRELELHLAQPGDEAVSLSRIRVDHRDADWSAFTVVDPVLPKQIAAHGEVVLHLRVDLEHFARRPGQHEYRSGGAGLTLNVDGEPTRIALHFADDSEPTPLPWIRLALLGLLAAALIAVRRRIAWTTSLPALTALAIAPLGAGLCWDIGATLGPADLQQCADGRGGASLQMLAHADGLGLWLAVLLFTAARGISTSALGRKLGLALAVLALTLPHGSLDPRALVEAQSGLRWGLWVQPFAAAALALVALAEVTADRSHAPLAGRVAALGLAAVFTTLCLGGPALPGFAASLPHAAAVGLGLLLWLLKAAGVTWLLLRVPLPPRTPTLVAALLLAHLLWSLLLAPAPVA